VQPASYEDRPSVPYAPLAVYRVAEAANVFIGVGSFVGVVAGGLIAGFAHIELGWRIIVLVGAIGAVGL
jgi:MFS family permease